MIATVQEIGRKGPPREELRLCELCEELRAEALKRGQKAPLCGDCNRRESELWDLCKLLEDRDAALARAGVPAFHVRKFRTPDRWPEDNREAQVRLDQWQWNKPAIPWSWLLTGPTGTTKTTVAVAYLWRAWETWVRRRIAALCCERCCGKGWIHGGPGESSAQCDCRRGLPGAFSCRFIEAARVPEIKFERAPEDGRRPLTWGDLVRPDLLVVDDLGRGHQGGGWEALGLLVSDRRGAEAATILTSNLDLEEISRADPHAADRLNEGAVATMGGVTFRRLEVPR